MEDKSKCKLLSDQEGIEDTTMTPIKVGFSKIVNNTRFCVFLWFWVPLNLRIEKVELEFFFFLEKRYKDKGIEQLLYERWLNNQGLCKSIKDNWGRKTKKAKKTSSDTEKVDKDWRHKVFSLLSSLIH